MASLRFPNGHVGDRAQVGEADGPQADNARIAVGTVDDGRGRGPPGGSAVKVGRDGGAEVTDGLLD